MNAVLCDAPDLLLARLAQGPAVLVTAARTQGSVPREAGTCMGVFADAVVGTIGGGHLEHEAIAKARQLLAGDAADVTQRFALGPSLGQCCGGVVYLDFQRLGPDDEPALRARLEAVWPPVAVFGGGHVGHALVQALLPLPYSLAWIDSREGIFAPGLPARVRCEQSEPVHEAVRDLPAGTQVLVMSFSHAEDLDIVAECLRRQRERQDLPFIGLIGSQTKWATFRHRLQARGFSPAELDQVTCPIGLPGIHGKEPAVIAAAVVAQLLLRRGR